MVTMNSDNPAQLTHGSLFSGIGGFDLGAEMSGIPTLFSCEVEERKRRILKKHFPDTPQWADIAQMGRDGRAIPHVDILSGGFPCQDISCANTSKNKYDENGIVKGIRGDRSGLWKEYARVLGEVKPRYIIFENSPLLLRRGLEVTLRDLAESGYHVEWQVLSACHFGYPHIRKRIYAIAYALPSGREVYGKLFRPISHVLSSRPSRQDNLAMPTQRFRSDSDFSRVQLYDGFSSQLGKAGRLEIEDFGNAVIPGIAHYLFECIKLFDAQQKTEALC